MIEARCILKSTADHSPTLSTFVLRYPKFIHGEFMTHRAFSRNASSSRAVPVAKNLEEVRSDELRAAPVFWGAEQKGMEPGAEITTEEYRIFEFVEGLNGLSTMYRNPLDHSKALWREAMLRAADFAERLHKAGAHKSIVNRLLEPGLHINVVATSCEPGLMNFFGLRLDKSADPTMRALAEAMWKAWREPEKEQHLKPGQWHLPFIEPDYEVRYDKVPAAMRYPELPIDIAKKVSVARCARVSYTSFETGKRSTIEEDLKLYDRLVGSQPLHASPAEHQATPDSRVEWKVIEQIGGPVKDRLYGAFEHQEQWGNLPKWRQYRKMLPGEAVAPLPEAYK